MSGATLDDYRRLRDLTSYLASYKGHLRDEVEKRDRAIANIAAEKERIADIEAGIRELAQKLGLGAAA